MTDAPKALLIKKIPEKRSTKSSYQIIVISQLAAFAGKKRALN
jgi:hypothetical protein